MKDWSKPVIVSDVDVAFPGSVVDLMPAWDEIPEEFKIWPGRNRWVRMFDDMFFSGVENVKFLPKKGIDVNIAWRHLRTISRSWKPQHEHKTAAWAYLASLWFEDVTYQKMYLAGIQNAEGKEDSNNPFKR